MGLSRLFRRKQVAKNIETENKLTESSPPKNGILKRLRNVFNTKNTTSTKELDEKETVPKAEKKNKRKTVVARIQKFFSKRRVKKNEISQEPMKRKIQELPSHPCVPDGDFGASLNRLFKTRTGKQDVDDDVSIELARLFENEYTKALYGGDRKPEMYGQAIYADPEMMGLYMERPRTSCGRRPGRAENITTSIFPPLVEHLPTPRPVQTQPLKGILKHSNSNAGTEKKQKRVAFSDCDQYWSCDYAREDRRQQRQRRLTDIIKEDSFWADYLDQDSMRQARAEREGRTTVHAGATVTTSHMAESSTVFGGGGGGLTPVG